MSTIRHFQLGPKTLKVSAPVTGGQLVMADTSNVGFVKPATAGAITVLGVAMTDAQPDGTDPQAPLDISWARPYVSVAYGPADVDVTYTTAAAHGDLLVAAAAGAVAKYTAGTSTYDQIVGRCTAEGGVLANAMGPMRLHL